MAKESKIGLKLEVCRDANNRLTIVAHFNADSPNIVISKNEYIWMPTNEEKELLNEAFELLPLTKTTIDTKINTKTEETVPIIEKEVRPVAPTTTSPDIEEKPPSEDLPPLEKNEEPAVFEITKEEPEIEEPKKEIDDEIEKNVDEMPTETQDNKTDDDTKKLDEDEGILVEADSEAIEAAIKKHKDKDKDESIVEADEKTIVDKVLSQKKKGKWRR
jgi:hypothetical protein